MIGALLALLAAPIPVADAERAFAAQAQRDGQWTAFRANASSDAIMFVPGRVNAQDWMRGRADPAKSVAWAPDAAATACDGSMAVTTGPYHDPDGGSGRFSTVWRRQADGGWKWVLDQGGPAPAKPLAGLKTKAVSPDCRTAARARAQRWSPLDMVAMMGAPGLAAPLPAADGDPTTALRSALGTDTMPLIAHGGSDDATLQWAIRGDDKGRRRMSTWVWDGRRFAEQLSQDTQ